MKKCVWFIMMALCPMLLSAQSETVNDYAVSWDSPSENSSGSMPIGNGEVGEGFAVGVGKGAGFAVSVSFQ